MDILEIRLVYNVVQFILLGFVRYGLFKDHLRISYGWAVSTLALTAGISSSVWYFFGQALIPFQYYRFGTILLGFALSCAIIKVQFAKHALSYITIFTVSAILDTLSLYVPLLFPSCVIPNVDTIALFVLLLVSLYPLYRLVGWITDRLSSIRNARVWNWLCLCGFSVVLLCLTTTSQNQPNAELLVSRIFLFLAMLGMYAAALFIQKSMLSAAETEVALELANTQVTLQQKYYDNLVAQMEEIRHIRHDLRHHRAALSAIIRSGDTQAAQAYINSWRVVDEGTIVTGNLVADSLLSYYCSLAKELDFSLEAEVSLPQLPAISEPDLCVLMGNLLGNALDAQYYLPPEQRYVRICANGDANSFTLAVDNRFDGTLIQENEQYRSRKDGAGHGLGLSSVRAVCKKYNGILQLEHQDDLFMAGVVIGL